MTWNIPFSPGRYWSCELIYFICNSAQLVHLSTVLNKPFQLLKISLLCLQTFFRNFLTLNSNCGYTSISKSAFCFASSFSLEWAVALIFCELELDWAFEFASFEFIFLVKLENYHKRSLTNFWWVFWYFNSSKKWSLDNDKRCC